MCGTINLQEVTEDSVFETLSFDAYKQREFGSKQHNNVSNEINLMYKVQFLLYCLKSFKPRNRGFLIISHLIFRIKNLVTKKSTGHQS